MVFTARLRVLLGIILLSCIQSVVNEEVVIETLSRIQKFFHCNYENHSQYAVAINVPKVQCQSGFRPKESNFLTNDPSERVEPYIKRDSQRVYRGNELIAAGVDIPNDVHSEYLLMNPPNNSYLTHLMNKTEDGCVVFYTLNSPCIAKCLNYSNRYNITPGLNELKAYKGIKAFVFTHIYTSDQGNNNLRTELKKIADRVPLYRCKSGRCILCGRPDSNRTVDNRCVN